MVIIELCLLNRFSVENLMTEDIKERIQSRNHYIVDVYEISYLSEVSNLWGENNTQTVVRAHSLGGFMILNSFSDSLDWIKIRKIIPRVGDYQRMKAIKGKNYT